MTDNIYPIVKISQLTEETDTTISSDARKTWFVIVNADVMKTRRVSLDTLLRHFADIFSTAPGFFTLKAQGGLSIDNLSNRTVYMGNTITISDNTTFRMANAAYNTANSGFIQANNAFTKSNSAYYIADLANTTAKFGYDQANNAYFSANNAFDKANSGYIVASYANTTANNLTISFTNHIQRTNGSAHQLATTTTAGFLSTTDKAKLDLLDPNDLNNTVKSFNSRRGIVSLYSSDVINALGYTPIQQGGGTGQLNNRIRIGWSASQKLRLHVGDDELGNFGTTWPINISGKSENSNYANTAIFAYTANTAIFAYTANTANTASVAAVANSVEWNNVAHKPFNWSGQNGQPYWLWGSNDGINYYVWNPSNFNVYSANTVSIKDRNYSPYLYYKTKIQAGTGAIGSGSTTLTFPDSYTNASSIRIFITPITSTYDLYGHISFRVRNITNSNFEVTGWGMENLGSNSGGTTVAFNWIAIGE